MNRVFDRIEDAETRRAAYVHSYGVSQCCVLLALKRGLDPELAAVIGLLHDIYSYKTGLTALHSENGADMVRVVFKRDLRDLFSEDEQTIIKSAIYHHSDKGHVHDEYDELLKDSDVLFLLSFRRSYDAIRARRLLRTMGELGLPATDIAVLVEEESTWSRFDPIRAADVAEVLASRRVTGEEHDPEYMKIVRYFPEDDAPGAFKNGWCAAFVYNCCLEAGLLLPIISAILPSRRPATALAV